MANQSVEDLKTEIDELEANAFGGSAPVTEEAEQDQPAEPEQDTPTEPEQAPQDESVEAQPEEKDELKIAEERIANAQRRMTQATQEAAELRRENESLKSENESLKAQVESLQQSAKSDSDTLSQLDEIGEEYEMIKPVAADLKKKDQLINELRQKIEQMSETSTDANAETQRQIHFNTIYAAHPDAQQVAESDAFQAYLANKDFEHQKSGHQGPYPSQIIQQGSAHEIVQVLNDYKASKTQTPSQDQVIEEARQAITPNPKQVVQPESTPSFTREQIAAMSPQEFAQNEDAIMQAMSEGKI